MAVSTRGRKSSKSPSRGAAPRTGTAQHNGAGRPRAHKWVYRFDEGSASMRDLLGGKGAGVAEMTRAGLPVPPGFTITTEACNAFYARGAKFPDGLWEQVEKALRGVEKATGKGFGDARNPLLVSVRSGAKFSMPGMMDTVLNLGLNSATLEGLAKLTKDRRFALDAHRRFIQLFSKIVLGIDGQLFEDAIDGIKKRKKARTDADLSAAALEELITEYRAIVKRHSRAGFPEDPMDQLRAAIGAVFE
jgi:pyruvate, orthophosphate dikinase